MSSFDPVAHMARASAFNPKVVGSIPTGVANTTDKVVIISCEGKKFRLTDKLIMDFDATYEPFTLIGVIFTMIERGIDSLIMSIYSIPNRDDTLKHFTVDIGSLDETGHNILTVTPSED